jgi:hypothetical protein
MTAGYYRTDEAKSHVKGNICERFLGRNENILDGFVKTKGTQQVASIRKMLLEESKLRYDTDLALTWISFGAFDFAAKIGSLSTTCGKQRKELRSDFSSLFPKERRWQDYGISLRTIPRTRLVELATLDTGFGDCVLRNPSEIKSFLKGNLALVSLIKNSFKYIRQIFGHNTNIELELIRDAESPTGEELVVFVQTPLRPEEALSKLHELDELWWIEASGKSNGRVSIHIEVK